MTTTTKPIRPYETRYWVDARLKRPISRGFPKAEVGSIEGASKAIARGFASKVDCIDRSTGEVQWMVKAGQRVRGVSIVPVEVFRRDPDLKRRESGRPQSTTTRRAK